MNFTGLKFVLLLVATIVNAKPIQNSTPNPATSIASTPKPATDRQLLTANLEEKSIFMLELKWSDETTKIVKLENIGEMDEDCIYQGSYIEDADSNILLTGCGMKSIQIQSPIFGDYLGTITLDGTFEVAEEAELIDDALENPDWNPTPNNVTIPEENTTPRPATDRQLLIANFEEESLNLTLKWSDEVMKIVKLESKDDMDEDCFYKGSYIEDHTSTIIITGCEMRTIQIQSPILGDYLGTITVNGTFEDAKEAYLIDDALENPDWNPTPIAAIPGNTVDIQSNGMNETSEMLTENPTSIASTPKPATDRQLLTANLEEKSIFMLELKWSDEATKIVKLESVGDIDEDCFYEGSYIEDSDSNISITGCELTNIQIQSPIFGDYLGTITVNGTFKVSEDAPLINDTVENPDWNPTIPEEPSVDIGAETTINPIEDCDCGDNDDECWEKCLSNTETSEEPMVDCNCRDNDDECWEKCLSNTETIQMEMEENIESNIKPTSGEFMADMDCGCGDNDDKCWGKCLDSMV